ncbi:MAG: alpha/beta fold hydrolase [Acidobacteria bacterium]|nr:alpha/beta fold hydrolase [Acidobacteriota bacterium]
MRRLSSPIEDIKNHYQIVVVGSGYGGSIAASRLARAGQQVCLLERGREIPVGEFPNTQPKVLGELQINLDNHTLGPRNGLYDLTVNKDINVFKGCGLGGTSLVNANVALRADRRVFDDHEAWPAGVLADLNTRVEEGIRRAEEMLKPEPYPSDRLPELKKLTALKKSAEAMGETFLRPPITVNFSDKVNHVGVGQVACTLCGDCLTGCNYGSKNTLAMNYLPDAHNHGATIFTQIDVRRIERVGSQWRMRYQILNSGREAFEAPEMTLTADLVILSGGALGSTEILLRSKAHGLALSERLGAGLTGNGDFLGFSYNSEEEINGVGHGHRDTAGRDPVGPTITGAIDIRNTPKLEDGMIIEEGSLAGGMADFTPLGLSIAAKALGKDTNPNDELREEQREAESLRLGPYHGAIKHTQTYLVMSHDDGKGRAVLENDRLRIRWPGVGDQPIFQKDNAKLLEATRPLGGTYLQNPTWTELTNQSLTTVHPLGGCSMSEDAERGVVNHKGQVFSGAAGAEIYDNLYISDGSVLPRPVGVNPLLTISALAERGCALIAEDRGWTIDYALPSIPSAEPPPLRRLAIRFTETMKGYFSTSVTDEDFREGERRGKQDDSPFQFILTITSDLKKALHDPGHPGRIVGSVIAPKLSSKPLTVNGGDFNLLTRDPDRPNVRIMKYHMKLTSLEGKEFFFFGFKTVRDDKKLDLWADTTTLYITIFDGPDSDSPVLGRGVLVIKPEDFMKQMTTMQVLNAKDPAEQLKATIDYGMFFGQELFEVYGGLLAKKTYFDKSPLPRVKRPLRMSAPELHYFNTVDNVTLKLTRYQGGTKGPVVLAPGFGTSTLAFSIDTIDTNFPEYLFASGYDVWLFDYRASPDLPSAETQFTLDDIATRDYPAALDKVRAITGAADVQVVVHCVGSMTFLMGALSGKVSGIRSAICSQLAFFPVSPPINEFRSGLRIASVLSALGVATMTTDFDETDFADKLADAVLKIFPTKGRFKSPVERLIQLIYGEVYNHDRLNAATHAAMGEMFGVANLRTFAHLANLVRKGRILNAAGEDVYLPHVDRLKFPITFIHGEENHLFLPEGTRQTMHTIAKANLADANLYQHIQFPNYSHMDFFIGENAAHDIFPTLAAQLDVHNQMASGAAGGTQ